MDAANSYVLGISLFLLIIFFVSSDALCSSYKKKITKNIGASDLEILELKRGNEGFSKVYNHQFF